MKELWKTWVPCGAGVKGPAEDLFGEPRNLASWSRSREHSLFLHSILLKTTNLSSLLEDSPGLIVGAYLRTLVVCATGRTKHRLEGSVANLRHWLEERRLKMLKE